MPRRYAAIYGALWRNSVVREMGFKSNFLLWIVVELLWFALQLCFIGVVYLHTDHIATWTKWQVVLLVGASHFIQQLFQAVFLSNLVQFSELVRTGRLGFHAAAADEHAVSSFVAGGGSRRLCQQRFRRGRDGLCRAPASFDSVAGQALGFLCLCVAGILIHYSLMFLLSSVAFWTVRAQGIVWGYYSFFNIARLPDAAFKGFFKAFFTFAIPMLLVANVPAKLLLNQLQSPGPMLLLVGMGCACFVISELFWRFSLRHYTSASA
jgi:ABC-2 type transport system permease protein